MDGGLTGEAVSPPPCCRTPDIAAITEFVVAHQEYARSHSYRNQCLEFTEKKGLKMKNTNMVWKTFIVISLIALLAFTCGCTGQEQATDSGTKVVTDMAGREVTIPKNIDSIVTIGPVPVMNSFIFAIGQGDKIANDLPESFVRGGMYECQYVIEPGLRNKPRIQATFEDINLEELMKINPDVAFTTSMTSVETLDKRGITVIYLPVTETSAEGVKDLMRLLGEVFGEQERAERYARYFDETVARPGRVVESLPDDQRPKVLYCNYNDMTAHHRWWIEEAGGISVAKNSAAARITFDPEKLIAWNPDVIIVFTPEQIALIQGDTRLSGVSAVKNGNVHVGPWSYSSDQPLMVLWTAKTIYPEQFKDLDMEAEVIAFYKEFFDCEITRDQAAEVLSRKPMSPA